METFDDTEKIFKEAGFQNIKITANDNSRELIREWDPDKSENAVDYVVSAYIEAIKQAQLLNWAFKQEEFEPIFGHFAMERR